MQPNKRNEAQEEQLVVWAIWKNIFIIFITTEMYIYNIFTLVNLCFHFIYKCSMFEKQKHYFEFDTMLFFYW